MPLYEYECNQCKHRFEKIQKFSDKILKKCPKCGGVLEQVVSAPAVQFKGSGWYVTDYAKKSSASHASSSESDGGSKDSKDSKDTREAKKEDKTKSDTSHKKPKKD